MKPRIEMAAILKPETWELKRKTSSLFASYRRSDIRSEIGRQSRTSPYGAVIRRSLFCKSRSFEIQNPYSRTLFNLFYISMFVELLAAFL